MPIRLDERLSAVASLVRCDTVADVGCDHGKLGFYLLQTDRAEKVIATDISPSSLHKAEKLALENGVEDRLITRLGDGLEPVKSGEADTVIIAGLGGDVISDIIRRADADGKKFPSFLLSPNTHPEKVRAALADLGHIIVSDGLTECSKKYYNIILSSYAPDKDREELDGKQLLFGKFYRTDKTLGAYLRRQLDEMNAILSVHESDGLKDKCRLFKEVLEEMTNED